MLGCIERVVATRVPADLPDKRAHCLAGAWIARQCSVAEAQLAAAGKEVRDALGAGDADRRDWEAARAGIDCAHRVAAGEGFEACCIESGW